MSDFFETGDDQTEDEDLEFEVGVDVDEEEVKGPDPIHWSDEARVDRGAYSEPLPTEDDDIEGEVKGPDPAQWPQGGSE